MALAGLWEHFLGRGLQVITSFSYKESVGKKAPKYVGLSSVKPKEADSGSNNLKSS
jgi:hypothetical protein